MACNNGLVLAITASYLVVHIARDARTIARALADGRLRTESNFGEFVKIDVSARVMTATGFDYRQKQFPESSFAVPNLAGFALCLANEEPTTIAVNGAP